MECVNCKKVKMNFRRSYMRWVIFQFSLPRASFECSPISTSVSLTAYNYSSLRSVVKNLQGAACISTMRTKSSSSVWMCPCRLLTPPLAVYDETRCLCLESDTSCHPAAKTTTRGVFTDVFTRVGMFTPWAVTVSRHVAVAWWCYICAAAAAAADASDDNLPGGQLSTSFTIMALRSCMIIYCIAVTAVQSVTPMSRSVRQYFRDLCIATACGRQENITLKGFRLLASRCQPAMA